MPNEHATILPRPFCRRSPRRHAFTLTELLVVISITVLLLAIAVPAFNAMTGSRSLAAAENNIVATLAQARMRAIAERAPHGVAFYRDLSSDRAAAAVVRCGEDGALEVVPNTNLTHLPRGVGIGFQHLIVANPATPTMADTDYIYDSIGYGTPNNDSNFFGIVLFDASGRFSRRPVGVYQDSEFGRRLGLSVDLGPGHPGAGGRPIYSQPAFLLFERRALETVAGAAPQVRVARLNDDATVILVNRYTGALAASE